MRYVVVLTVVLCVAVLTVVVYIVVITVVFFVAVPPWRSTRPSTLVFCVAVFAA